MTGAVDLVLPVAKIPEIIAKYGRQMVLKVRPTFELVAIRHSVE